MAVLFSATSSLWTDSLWKTVDTASYLNSEAASTATTTAYVSSSVFTPGAITVEGILLKIKGRTGATGLFSTELFNSTDNASISSVTCNVTDIRNDDTSLDGGWCYFKFASTQSLTAGKNYTVRVKTSGSATVNVYRDGTTNNWSRGLVTTTTASLTSLDSVIICGDIPGTGSSPITNSMVFNITSSAVTHSTFDVGAHGVVVGQNSSATTYNLIVSGNFITSHNGIVELSTSGSRLPADSALNLIIFNPVNGNSSIRIRNYSTLRAYGDRSRNTRRAIIAANVNAGATTFTTDVATNWKKNDTVVVGINASVTLAEDAVGTTVSCSALPAISSSINAKVQSYIGNITTNLNFYSTSGYYFTANKSCSLDLNNVAIRSMVGVGDVTAGAGAGCTASFVECTFYYGSGGANGNYLVVSPPTPAGYNLIDGCIVWGRGGNTWAGITITGTTVNPIIFQNSSVFDNNGNKAAISISGYVSASNIIAHGTGASNLISITSPSGSISNIIGRGGNQCQQFFVFFSGPASTKDVTISNILGYGGGAYNTPGINFVDGSRNYILDTVEVFGVASSGANIGIGAADNITIKNGKFYGTAPGAAITSIYGVSFGNPSSNIFFENCSFGSGSSNTTSDLSGGTTSAVFRNCSFYSSTLLANQTSLGEASFMKLAKFNTSGSTHRTLKRFGVLTTDSTIYNTSVRSQRMTPNNASYKLRSSPIYVPLTSGSASTISVAVRYSLASDGTAYNGNFPRLIIAENPTAGSAFNSDIVASTATIAASGSWETLTYTTPVPTDNAVVTAYVDCDGTTGWVNWDTVNLGTGTSSLVYYADGEPYILPPTTGSITLGGERSYTFTG